MQTKKLYMTLGILTILSGNFILLPVISLFTNNITIKSTGNILARVLFDGCDSAEGWKISSYKSSSMKGNNILEVNAIDKVEGTCSLNGTFAADGANWGGMFYKRSTIGFWDLTKTPLMRMHMKLYGPIPSGADFHFELVTSYSWDVWVYEIRDNLTVGEWIELSIDLRCPTRGPSGKLPNLKEGIQIAIVCFGAPIYEPFSVGWDFITVETGPYIPPQIELTPIMGTTIVNEPISFFSRVLGGEGPHSYVWFVNGTRQTGETSNTFIFSASTVGKYNVTVVVTDNRGNTGSATAWITVLNPPPEQPPIPQSLDVFKSEVRGMFVHLAWGRANWTKIAETCFNYGINTAFVDVQTDWLWDYSNGGIIDFPELRTAVNAFHQKGIRIHALLITMTPAPIGMRALTSTGEVNWLDVNKNSSRQMLKAVVESLATNYGLDGIMFDYVRWIEDRQDMPLGDEAKANFISYTGLNDVNWPDDVLSGGRYYNQFLNWRCVPINEIVRDMSNWIKNANPNMMVSAAVWAGVPTAGWYQINRIGQHTAEWIDQGYLDFVAPMIYTTDPDWARDYTLASLDFFVGGAEGKIPLIAFVSPTYTTPEIAAQIINATKNAGADGWIIWRYGGPGLDANFPDIRPYLAVLYEAGLMEPVWAIQNFTVIINGNTATISWTTTVPTTSKIEYKNGEIFNGTINYQNEIMFKDITYTGGTMQTNTTLSTTHSFTILIANDTEFRIQSTDINNKVITSCSILISKLKFNK